MAELPRYRESGLVSGDIPRLDFANIREQAQGMSTVSSALDRLSEFAFGAAKKEQDRLDRMADIQARFELEGIVSQEISKITNDLGSGKFESLGQVQSRIQALSGLAQAGLKTTEHQQGLMQSIASSGRSVMAKASDIFVKNHKASTDFVIGQVNEASIVNFQTDFETNQDFGAVLKNKYIGLAKIRSQAEINGGDVGKAMEGYEKAYQQARTNFVRDFIANSEDPVIAYQMIKSGKTDNPMISQMLKTSERAEIFKAADDAMKDYNTTIDNVAKANTERAKTIEVEWADAIRSGDDAAIKSILTRTRIYDTGNYEKRLSQYEQTGGMFATTNNAMVVKDLDERLANPYGKNPPTISELLGKAGNLTQEKYSSYLERIKSFSDSRVKVMRERAASELGMTPGPVLIKDAARRAAEAKMDQLDVKFIDARRLNPDLDPLTWFDENKDKIFAKAAATTNANLQAAVTGRAIKTIKGFESAIRDAQHIGDVAQANTLALQLQDLRDAIKAGLVDENGNPKTAGAAK